VLKAWIESVYQNFASLQVLQSNRTCATAQEVESPVDESKYLFSEEQPEILFHRMSRSANTQAEAYKIQEHVSF
jgi:hypothetical protein